MRTECSPESRKVPPCKIALFVISLLILSGFTSRAWALQSKDHRSISADAATSSGFSPQAVKLIAQAATEPDQYDWDTAAAHAQTPNDDSGRPTLSAQIAEQQTEAYLRSQAAALRRELNQNNVGNALYILGYALHTIQDYAAHLGMTNAEHAFLAVTTRETPQDQRYTVHESAPTPHLVRGGLNPDLQPQSIERAREWTREFFIAARESLGPCDWEKLKLFTARTEPGDHWRDLPGAEAKRETDFADYGRYEALIRQFKSLPDPQRSVRWSPSSQVHQALIRSFTVPLKDSSDDKSRLFIGEWLETHADGRTDKVSITAIQPGIFLYYLEGTSRKWRMTGDSTRLRGDFPVDKSGVAPSPPDFIFAQAAAQLKHHVSLTISESPDCKILYERAPDGLQWELAQSKDGSAPQPTGKYWIIPKDPALKDNATLKRLKN